MANPNPRTENLKPFNKLTVKEQRKIQSKGGIKSGESKRKTKELVRISSFLHEFIDNQQEDVRISLKKIVKAGGLPLIKLFEVIIKSTEGEKLNIIEDIIIIPAPGLKKRNQSNDTKL